MHSYTNKPIKEWAVEDRPREKLLQKGIDALTDAELLAILLSTGTRELSAIGLARHILDKVGSLKQLASSTVEELTRIRGIGNAKAISMMAAFELGRRKASQQPREWKVDCAETAAAYLKPMLSDLRQEVFYVIFLNRNNTVIGEKQLFKGGVAATIIDPKIVFREAINHLASSIIIAHNHPSGSLIPSVADLEITKKLASGGEIFEIPVIDHIIISSKGYYSFADEGRL